MTRLFPSRDDQVPSCYLYCLSSTSKQQTNYDCFSPKANFFPYSGNARPLLLLLLSKGASSCNLVIFDKSSSHLSSKYNFFPFFFLFRKAKKVRRRRVSTRLEFALMRIPLFTGQHVFEGPKQEEGQLISGDFHFRGKHTHLSILPFFHYFYKIDLWPSLLKEDHHFMQIEFLGLPQKYIGNWIGKMVGAATV